MISTLSLTLSIRRLNIKKNALELKGFGGSNAIVFIHSQDLFGSLRVIWILVSRPWFWGPSLATVYADWVGEIRRYLDLEKDIMVHLPSCGLSEPCPVG